MVHKSRRTRPDRRRKDEAVIAAWDRSSFPYPHLGAALFLAIAAYWNALGNGFVLDDIGIIVDNPLVRSGPDLRTIFTSPYWPVGTSSTSPDPTLYRPLTVLSFVLNAPGPGLNANAFHAVNIALHVLATALVFLLALRLFATASASLAGAALFAVHPVHTEAVTGIVGRADVMATVFFLSAFLILRRREAFSGRWSLALGWSVLGALLWLCGLLSKEIAATLPIVLALDDWLHRRDFSADRSPAVQAVSVRYATLGIAAVVFVVLRENAVSGGSQIWPGFVDVSGGARVLTASRVMLEYIGLLVFPVPLLADYWVTEVPIATSLLNPAVLASLALWVGITVLLWKARGGARIILPVAWFLITLAPVSNIFFPIGVAKAERFLYLPSVGFCLLTGWLATAVARYAAARTPARVALGVVVLAFTIVTLRRNHDWKDNLTLAQATLRVSPASPLMNDVAAGELMKLGEVQRALPLLQEAARQAPGLAFVRAHLGTVYAALGMRAQSESEYVEALRLNPSDASTHNNLGVLYLETAREAQALELFQKAIAIAPAFADPHTNLGTLYLDRGNLAEAASEFTEAIRLNPASADAHNNYGLVLSRLGRRDQAADHYREALRLDPDHPKARANLSALERPM